MSGWMLPEKIPVVIFAGGRGARFDATTLERPKPMVELARKPILQHIIDGFIAQGFKEFIIPVGYLGHRIEEHFLWQVDDFWSVRSGGCLAFYSHRGVDIYVVQTGADSHVGQRLAKVKELIGDRRFIMTYGDGLSDVSMSDVIMQHEIEKAGVTMTVVHPPGRFGVVDFHVCDDGVEPYPGGYTPPCRYDNRIESFTEKPAMGWINGGFMVAEPEFIDRYIEEDNHLEATALSELAAAGGLHGYRHTGYWRCIDTRRDLEQAEQDIKDNGGILPWRRDMMEGKK